MGNGTYTSEELVDTLLVDLNMLPKFLINNQYIGFCKGIADIGQKMILLKKGIHDDIANKNKLIEQMKRQNELLGGEYNRVTNLNEKEDAHNGTE